MIRVAVVGCGYWGPNLIRNFAGLQGCELAAICDLDPERLASAARRYPGARATADFDRVLTDRAIDALAVCTPLSTHHPLAKAALRAGKHVLLTKPMTHSVASAEELIELAASRGLTLQVDHTFVYSAAVGKLKSIIAGGEIGDLLYFDSVRINLGLFQSDTNVLWDLAPHDFSIMSFLIDQVPVSVSAIGIAHYGEFENLAYVTVRFEDSLIAHFHLNWLAPVKLRSTLIGGSKRMIVFDDLEPSEKIRIYDKGVALNQDPGQRARALVDYRTGDMLVPHVEQFEPLERVCQAFLDAIGKGVPPLTDGRAGLEVVRLLEAAQRSIDHGGEPVKLGPGAAAR